MKYLRRKPYVLLTTIFSVLVLSCCGCGAEPEKSDDPAIVEQERQEYKANAQREIEDIRGAEQ